MFHKLQIQLLLFSDSISVSGDKISLGPDLQSEAITGSPHCIASTKEFGKPSNVEDRMYNALLEKYLKGLF